MTTNDELVLRIARHIATEYVTRSALGVTNYGFTEQRLLDFVHEYDSAKVEAMQPEVKEMVDKLRRSGRPFDTEYKAADLIERLATAQGDRS